MDIVLANISSLRDTRAHWPFLLDREPGSAGVPFCNHSMAGVNAADRLRMLKPSVIPGRE